MTILAAVMVTVLAVATGFILASESTTVSRATADRRQAVGCCVGGLGMLLAVAYAITSAATQ